MRSRWEGLIAGVEARIDQLVAVIDRVNDAAWASPCTAEGWPLALVAYHIGRGLQRQAGWIIDVLQGRPPHDFSWDETHELNAAVSREHPLPSRGEVRQTACEAIGDLRRSLGALGDEGLDRVVFVNEGRRRDITWLLERLMPRHADEHLESIAATLDKAL